MEDNINDLMGHNPVSKSLYPSRAYLSRLEKVPQSILEYLIERFPHIAREVWKSRVNEGAVFLDDGSPISQSTPYQQGKTVLYFREVPEEPLIPFQERIVFQNEHFLIVDKPHFIPVTPSGSCVNQCLLSRLRKATELEELTPVHRLDRETAGLVLFVAGKKHRGLFQGMFERGAVLRQYLAVAAVRNGVVGQEWLVENRLVRGEPWFRMKIVEGEKNAVTRIVLKEQRGDTGVFELFPETGKKHQLRLHLASLGFPILNDPLYPELRSIPPQDYSNPLQLVAKRLSFQDPVTGHYWEFESERIL
jgi:tRNA pseudouridine32 synthase / 23S rRNA pseudouridine746 synthase